MIDTLAGCVTHVGDEMSPNSFKATAVLDDVAYAKVVLFPCAPLDRLVYQFADG